MKMEMGGACNAHGGEERCIQGFRGETWGKPRRRWEVIIKIDLQEVGRAGMYWIDLAQDGDGWRPLLNAVMNLRVPQNAGNLFTSW